MPRMQSPILATQTLIDRSSAEQAFQGTVVSVTDGNVRLTRPDQQGADPTTYRGLVINGASTTAGLQPGDRVSVVKHGASWIVMGKVDSLAGPLVPPDVPPPTPAAGTYLGVWQPDPAVDGNLSRLSQFETDCGKHQAIVAFWRDWVVASKGTIPASTLSQIGAHGSVPFLTWSPADFSGATDPATFSLANITGGSFDSYLATQAATLHTYGKPVFLRTMHEMNGTWYPWAGDPVAYVPAWRHIHDVVSAVAGNVLWVWCPNVWTQGDVVVSDPAAYYPGDAYVDWVGMDGYNSQTLYGSWQTFTEIFGFAYGQLLSAHAKPLLVAETGCDEDSRKAAWFTSTLANEIPKFFPHLSGFCYFNESKVSTDGLGTNWPIESDAAAQSAYRNGVSAAYYLTAVP